ncbi:chemotaxis protein CheY [Anditalea andensis]|uniref:Chemotaxis protein CheY n=2 Tax=Anditalea andensis TaxID=1048983 RepID=A0A074KXF7_9BACT|nr:chemotaxis protein CheY [Anditalea andensis]
MKNKDLKSAHILLVEDNEGDIVLTLEAFEESKAKTEVSVVRNGREALEFLYKKGKYQNVKKPDLILLDINIPIFNGHEVLQLIKEDSDLKRIPVVMLTTSSSHTDIQRAYDNHSNSYIMKSLDMEEFFEAIVKIEEFWFQVATLAD